MCERNEEMKTGPSAVDGTKCDEPGVVAGRNTTVERRQPLSGGRHAKVIDARC